MLDKDILEMHNAADILMEFSWPRVSMEDERVILCLKEREVFTDGYYVCLVLSKNDHRNHIMHTLQIYASFGAFLPFSLVCSLANRFLGDKGLYYVSVIQNDRKIYIWTVCFDYANNVVSDKSYDTFKDDAYNGINFRRVLNVGDDKFF